MKQFLNVLYRRILYKIPLKFLLILLAVFAVFIASVKAEFFQIQDFNAGIYGNGTNPVQAGVTKTLNSTYGDTICFNSIDNTCNNIKVKVGNDEINGNVYLNNICYKGFGNNSISFTNTNNTSCSYGIIWFYYDTVQNVFNVPMTSLECQTEYNLIPISSVDQNYCTTNNLCPTCQVCPSGSGSISTLYINDILHVGSPFIYMNIPEEIGRDYAYTQGGTNMFIDVEGYNVDYDKISDILEVQNYKPTSDDFSQVVSNLTPYVKILVFVLFVFIIWKWIKGGFKSKLK